MENLQELLLEEIKDLYSAEKQIVKALPQMIKGISSAELKSAIQEHLEVTKGQVTRLEEVFSHLEQKPKAKPCKGMEGLLAEGAEALQEGEAGTLRDLQIIGAAQRVEHYEMAAYGTAKTMAEKLELSEAAELLDQTLTEEEEADAKLTEVAESLYEEVQSGEGAEDVEDEKERAVGSGPSNAQERRGTRRAK